MIPTCCSTKCPCEAHHIANSVVDIRVDPPFAIVCHLRPATSVYRRWPCPCIHAPSLLIPVLCALRLSPLWNAYDCTALPCASHAMPFSASATTFAPLAPMSPLLAAPCLVLTIPCITLVLLETRVTLWRRCHVTLQARGLTKTLRVCKHRILRSK